LRVSSVRSSFLAVRVLAKAARNNNHKNSQERCRDELGGRPIKQAQIAKLRPQGSPSDPFSSEYLMWPTCPASDPTKS
jgi:hypothetical protein